MDWLRAKSFQDVEFRNDQGRTEHPTVSDQDELIDELALEEQILDRLGCDVLSPGTDEQMLLPIGDHEMPFAVEHPDVSRVEPAILVDDLRRGPGVL